MHICLFANPIAGRGRGQAIADRLALRLRHGGHSISGFQEEPGTLNPRVLLDASPDAVIVVGGDGTLRGVAEQLVGTFAADRIPPILLVPLGTANLMGRHLSINWQADQFELQIASALERRRIVRVDVARAGDKIFLLMVGVGIDGAIVHELSRVRKGPIDFSSYVLPTALALQAYSYPALQVIVDDRELFAMAPGMAFVGNVREYGTGFPILPHARSDDGLLDVCVLPCRSRPEAVQLALRAAAGEHLQIEGVVYTTGRRIKIDSAELIPVQIDGEAAGHTPVDIELLPVKLPFIVP